MSSIFRLLDAVHWAHGLIYLHALSLFTRRSMHERVGKNDKVSNLQVAIQVCYL
jgi:hypothetical protein